MSEPTVLVGGLIPPNAKRDAIHFALAPVIASHELLPGEHIGLDPLKLDGEHVCSTPGTTLHGIVDPFLPQPVQPEQRFWMFLYPNTVTGMRHAWEHPDFPEKHYTEFTSSYASLTPEQASTLFLVEWCKNNMDAPSYGDLIDAAENYDGYGYLTIYGSDAQGNVPSDVWHHLGVVLGKKLGPLPEGFSCSC